MTTELSSTKVAGGTLRRVKHASAATTTDMVFAIFTPAAIPRLVDKHLAGQLPIDHFISHTLQGVESTNEAIHILESGECLRCVVIY